MGLKVLVFGTTGMVGEGAMHECLNHPYVETVFAVNRRTCGVQHEKLKEIIHSDFHNFEPLANQLKDLDAAYFCLGVSSLGMKKEDYFKITYDLTLHVAQILKKVNPEMVFTYVSGSGTDSTEQGKVNWANVKGKTENDLLKLFDKAFMYRPGYIQPTTGLKNTYKVYKLLAPFYPLWNRLFPAYVCTLKDLGLSMLYVTLNGFESQILDNRAITLTGKRESERLSQTA